MLCHGMYQRPYCLVEGWFLAFSCTGPCVACSMRRVYSFNLLQRCSGVFFLLVVLYLPGLFLCCDHGWIRAESVYVKCGTTNQINQSVLWWFQNKNISNVSNFIAALPTYL